jgi:FkbM family methyltransferase
MLSKIGHKISRLGDVIQQPRLISLYLRGIKLYMFTSLDRRWLANSDIRTVIDIGANTGQFARAIHEVLPGSFIYSFEPLSDCFRELQQTMRGVKRFKAFNTALGDGGGEAVIYRSERSSSSSLLPMAELHKENFPSTAKMSKETTNVRKLDEYCDELDIEDQVLIKLDVQGYEDRVIAGGMRLVQRAKILIVEISMEPLYEGQPLFREIFTTLDRLSFIYKGNLSQMSSPIDGRVLSADAVFVHEE